MKRLKLKIWLALPVLFILACGPLSLATPTLAPAIATDTPEAAPTVQGPTDAPAATTAPEQPVITVDNANNLKETGSLNFDAPFRLIWSPDSSTLAVMSNHHLALYDVHAKTQSGDWAFNEPDILLDYSAALHSVALTADQASLTLRDISGAAAERSIRPDAPFSSAAFSPDGKSLLTTSVDEIAVTLWDTSNGEVRAKMSGFETAAPVYSAEFSADGKTLIWKARGTVQLMNLPGGELSPVFSHEDFVSALALSPDGNILATSAGGTLDGNFVPLIYLWDAHNGAQKGQLKPADISSAVSFSPGGHLLAAGVGNQLTLWNVDSQQLIASLPGHSDRLSAVAFSPDGKMLATCAADNSVRLWVIKP